MAKRRSYYGTRKKRNNGRLFMAGLLAAMILYGGYLWLNKEKSQENPFDNQYDQALGISPLPSSPVDKPEPLVSPEPEIVESEPIRVIAIEPEPQPIIHNVAVEPINNNVAVEPIVEPEPTSQAAQMYQQGRELFQNKDYFRANQKLSAAIDAGLSQQQETATREMINQASDIWLLTPQFYPGDIYSQEHIIASGSNLEVIASRYDINAALLQRINRIDNPNRIRAGQKIKAAQGPFHIIVEKSKYRLSVYIGNNAELLVRSYPVTIGMPGRDTPTGHWTVSLREMEPVFIDRENNNKFYDRNAPDNPLGSRWIGLDYISGNTTNMSTEGIGIHGTVEEHRIGTAASRGCIRMKNAEVELLYDMVRTGKSKVQIIE